MSHVSYRELVLFGTIAFAFGGACGSSSQLRANRSNAGSFDGIWIPADGVWAPAGENCSESSRQQLGARLSACGIEQPRFGWQYPSPVLFRGDHVTVKLIWTTGSLGIVVGRAPGYYTIPFRERPVGRCPGSVMEFRNPRGGAWTPFVRVVDGQLIELAEFGCGWPMLRAVGEHARNMPSPLQEPPRPYFETREFIEDPSNFGFQGMPDADAP